MAGLCGISSVAHAQALISRGSAGWEALEALHAQGNAPGLHLTHAPVSRHTVLERLAQTPDSLLSDAEREVWAARIAPKARLHGPSRGLQPLLAGYVGRAESDAHTFARIGISGFIENASVFAEGRVLHSRPSPDFFGSLAPLERGMASEADAAPFTDWTFSVGYRSRFFEVRAGRDRHQWGPGVSSVILSGHGAPYPYVQIRASAWRMEFVQQYMVLTDRQTPRPHTTRPYARYAAMHRVNISLPKGFELGFFEQIIHTDTSGTRRGLDRLYLNPVVFYRSVEQDMGSPDNALLGADGSWRVRPGVVVYGQLTLDELYSFNLIGEERWENKWGWLYGIRLAGWPLRTATFEVERATLRPYLYSHQTPSSAFLHEFQTLGHPAGPNSRETLVRARWEPGSRWRAELLALHRTRGRDEAGSNLGGNAALPYTTRPSDVAPLFQGVRERTLLGEGLASVRLAAHTWLDAGFRAVRIQDDVQGTSTRSTFFLGLRMGLHPARTRG